MAVRMLQSPMVASRGGMGQKQRDQYNIARGGQAGMATLIPSKSAKLAAGGAVPLPSPVNGAGGVPFDQSFGSPGSAEALWNDFQSKQTQANAANDNRYKDILGGYDQIMGTFDNAGAQQAADINQGARNQGAQVQQNLVSSGLAGTTVMPTLQAGVERQRVANQARLNEQLQGQRAGMAKNRLDFMERRTDQAPDPNMYMNLIQKIGEGGFGPQDTMAGGPGGGAGVGGVGPMGAGGGMGPGMVNFRDPANGISPGGGGSGGGVNKQRPLTLSEQLTLQQGGMLNGYTAPQSRGTGSVSVGAPTGAGAATRRKLKAKPVTRYDLINSAMQRR